MLESMTGFGSKEAQIKPFGKVSVELRSINHKFLETVIHVPEGFLFLEDRIKREIENKIKRGRVTCVMNIFGDKTQEVFINEKLLKKYVSAMERIKQQFDIQGALTLDAAIHLPGVLSLTEDTVLREKIWPELKGLIVAAVNNLAKMRKKEGAALSKYLKRRSQILKSELEVIKKRFKESAQIKMAELQNPDERAGFLKDADISEEIERLEFHIKNLSHKLSKTTPVGKELDFIAQEMQRETNTIGAKSCDSLLSNRVIQIKSQIEKIREQAQNIE